jgi:hypothetical protein
VGSCLRPRGSRRSKVGREVREMGATRAARVRVSVEDGFVTMDVFALRGLP